MMATASADWSGYAYGIYGNMYGSQRLADNFGGKAEEMGIMRRSLDDVSTTYISYAALTADTVPCSTAGDSYYSCGTTDPANAYTTSCTDITLCARDTS
ncbi:hypothetical protein KP509_27G044900 [Ceratopteris richardii]|nr:hypothetical protein KP509_27G044900 [Ceratopteris richardii]